MTRRLVQGLLVVTTVVGGAGAAHATEAPASARPGFELAVAAGVSRDQTGFTVGQTRNIPLFYVMGGFGHGTFGVDAAVLSTSAVGRFDAPNQPVDRISAEGVLIVRPAVPMMGDRIDYGARVAKRLAIGAGPAWEHLSSGRAASSRWGVRFSVHVDLPLGREGPGGTFAFRLGVRRLLGFERARVQTVDAGDSQLEAFAGLAVAF